MPISRSHRLLTLVTAAAVTASLAVATVAGPVSAAKPKCQGKVATIVGTGKGEIIRGTARRDVIVAKGGHDRIYGKGGNDLICAGGGNDLVYGGPGADTVWGQVGNDRLLGNAGPDFLAGQIGNDTINGGLQVDTCYQGTGTGAVLNCELPAPVVVPPPPPPAPPVSPDADLAVELTCPAAQDEGTLTCEAKVTNLGPSATAYELDPGDSEFKGGNTVSCTEPAKIDEPSLAPGAVRSRMLSFQCSLTGASPGTIYVEAEVTGVAPDPNLSNNLHEVSVTIN